MYMFKKENQKVLDYHKNKDIDLIFKFFSDKSKNPCKYYDKINSNLLIMSCTYNCFELIS